MKRNKNQKLPEVGAGARGKLHIDKMQRIENLHIFRMTFETLTLRSVCLFLAALSDMCAIPSLSNSMRDFCRTRNRKQQRCRKPMTTTTTTECNAPNSKYVNVEYLFRTGKINKREQTHMQAAASSRLRVDSSCVQVNRSRRTIISWHRAVQSIYWRTLRSTRAYEVPATLKLLTLLFCSSVARQCQQCHPTARTRMRWVLLSAAAAVCCEYVPLLWTVRCE